MLKYSVLGALAILSVSSPAIAICNVQYFQVNNNTSTTLQVYSHSTHYTLASGDNIIWETDFATARYNGAGNEAGHFTQIAWGKTRFIGCSFRADSNSRSATTLICNYYPGGTFGTRMPPYAPTSGSPGDDPLSSAERAYPMHGMSSGCQSKDFARSCKDNCKMGINVTDTDLIPKGE